ncbi:hypothetical protein N7495_002055 [Penicillium taxi]|uniref:uncharacterized protein n=1 Tax=Penicillium taxi TaxID=168475 RepID=UPI0025459715|nr:uncharacterized protein N7495_002055 [Penicillium taxi]KAJ5901527.1 hypothetical protein N7495_002055 [Penicillium taxi]
MATSPLRVLVIVSQRSTLISKARDSPQDMVPLALRLLKKSNMRAEGIETRLLAVQNWPTRIYIVFDIANADYDATLGHLPEQNRLPVDVARFSKKRLAYKANPWVSQRVNHDIAMLHNANGFGTIPPFTEDHSLGKPPAYRNPRDITMLRVSYIEDFS